MSAFASPIECRSPVEDRLPSTLRAAEDGMQAIEKCRDNNYDIVIMDIMMPNLDGFSACREIRKKSDVPILMLSARGEEYEIGRAHV